jgi:elongation factor P
VIEVTYKGSEQPVRANFEQRNGQFLYKEDADYHFMDMTTFEQFMLDDEMLGFSANFLVPEMEVVVAYWEEKPVGIEIPPKMEVTVTETIDEVERGNTANAVTKDATLENGMTIQVPPFIKTGEKIRISTDDGSYVERA